MDGHLYSQSSFDTNKNEYLSAAWLINILQGMSVNSVGDKIRLKPTDFPSHFLQSKEFWAGFFIFSHIRIRGYFRLGKGKKMSPAGLEPPHKGQKKEKSYYENSKKPATLIRIFCCSSISFISSLFVYRNSILINTKNTENLLVLNNRVSDK